MEDQAIWGKFLQWLHSFSLEGVKLPTAIFSVTTKPAPTPITLLHSPTSRFVAFVLRAVPRTATPSSCRSIPKLDQVSSYQLGNKKYMNMKNLETILENITITNQLHQ